MADPKVKVGDWVRFYQNGRLVISEVRAMRKQESYPWGIEALTLDGAVHLDNVVEVRRG